MNFKRLASQFRFILDDREPTASVKQVPAPIKILIVENDLNDLELLHSELRKGNIDYISENVQNEQSYTNALLKGLFPDLIMRLHTSPLTEKLLLK